MVYSSKNTHRDAEEGKKKAVEEEEAAGEEAAEEAEAEEEQFVEDDGAKGGRGGIFCRNSSAPTRYFNTNSLWAVTLIERDAETRISLAAPLGSKITKTK